MNSVQRRIRSRSMSQGSREGVPCIKGLESGRTDGKGPVQDKLEVGRNLLTGPRPLILYARQVVDLIRLLDCNFYCAMYVMN